MLEQQIAAAAALGKRFKLRMQVNSFDAVSHMVASGLGVALLPKVMATPLLKTMKLGSRPLKDTWAQRRLMIAIRSDADPDVRGLRDYLMQS